MKLNEVTEFQMLKIKRRHIRHPLSIRVSASLNDVPGESYFYCEDLSYGGMYLKSDFLFEQGDVVELSFELPDERKSEITVKARVAWVNLQMVVSMQARASGMGMEFIDMSDECMRRLRDYLASREIEVTDLD